MNLLDPEFGLAAALKSVGIQWFADVLFRRWAVRAVQRGVRRQLALLGLLSRAPRGDAGDRRSQYEAARINGANAWQEFWHNVLPEIRPTLTLALTVVAISSLFVCNYPLILTNGGPRGLHRRRCAPGELNGVP